MPDPSAWRIDKRKWVSVSFDGSGAAKEGGRWNSAGVRVVYCSRNLAMAAQERYVHLPKPVSMQLVKFRVHFGKLTVETVGNVPPDWKIFPPPVSTQQIGDEWAGSRRTPILAVPSVLIPEETNYLLNPLHPDFGQIAISGPEEFVFDSRVARLHEPPAGAMPQP